MKELKTVRKGKGEKTRVGRKGKEERKERIEAIVEQEEM